MNKKKPSLAKFFPKQLFKQNIQFTLYIDIFSSPFVCPNLLFNYTLISRFVGRPKANLKLNRHSSYISSPGDRLKGLVRGGVQDLLRGGGGGQDLLRGAGDGQQVVRGGGGGQEVVRGGGGGQEVLRGGAGVQEIVMGGGGGKGPVRGGQEIVPGGGSRQAPTRGGNGRRNLSPQSGPHGSKLFFNSSGSYAISKIIFNRNTLIMGQRKILKKIL